MSDRRVERRQAEGQRRRGLADLLVYSIGRLLMVSGCGGVAVELSKDKGDDLAIRRQSCPPSFGIGVRSAPGGTSSSLDDMLHQSLNLGDLTFSVPVQD